MQYISGVSKSGGVAAARPMEAGRAPDRAVGIWLLVVCAMLVAMILLGGATRLTDSGLSITQWQPITGAVPPLSARAWESAFRNYQATAEYRLQNAGMSLADFKTIYFWEWAHRFLGRAIGLVFVLPFCVFWALGRLRGRFWACLGLLALGALQGGVGWWMVQSGLGARLDVAPYRLATHLGLAFVILGFSLLLALSALGWPRTKAAMGLGRAAWAGFAALLFLQILAGAAVAGSDAGRAYTDWPTLGGAWVPPGYGRFDSIWYAVFEDHAVVQFHHRLLGYCVAGAAVWLGLLARQHGIGAGRVLGAGLGLAAVGQMGLGIVTVMHAAPLGLSLAHQGGAILLWALAFGCLRISLR